MILCNVDFGAGPQAYNGPGLFISAGMLYGLGSGNNGHGSSSHGISGNVNNNLLLVQYIVLIINNA